MYKYFAILPHSTEPLVFVKETENGWTLPYWRTTRLRHHQVVDDFIRAMKQHFGWDITVLDCTHAVQGPDMKCTRAWYLVENRGRHPVALPPGTQWIGQQEFVNVADADHRTRLEHWHAEQSYAGQPEQRPWANRGWFHEASDWIAAQLSNLGLRITGMIEQLRTWERCCLLRIGTDRGYVYFKALPRMFSHEVRLTQLLAERHPALFPELIAVDDSRHWMLMREMQGQTLTSVSSVERWEEALHQYAEIQIDSTTQQTQLISPGCPNRPLTKLKEELGALAYGLPTYDCLAGIDESRLRAKCSYLQHLCDELAQYDIPATLEHGDFWPENIMVDGKRYTYFDWSDSSISHPFFSLYLFLREDIRSAVSHIHGIKDRLRDAYLSRWTAYEPMSRLVAAFDLAQQIAVAHNTITYHRYVLPNIKAKWQCEDMLRYYVRLLLQ